MRVLLALALLLAACTTEPTPLADEPAAALARPSEAAVAERVAEAAERLEATDAGRLVLAATEAHGGLAQWYRSGPVHFRYRYERGGGEPPIDTEQTVDTWSARARHTVMPDGTAEFGWTGDAAWTRPAGAQLPTNARFWSLTPYYFAAMPFVLADPGVNLDAAGHMTAEGRTYDLVRASFDAGTGDAPDDYYVLLLDPETRRVGGVRYVVSYPGFYPEGEASPERLMLYDGTQSASGITLQEGFRSFAWTAAGAGDPAATGTLTGLRFVPDAPDSLFAMPDGAGMQQGM